MGHVNSGEYQPDKGRDPCGNTRNKTEYPRQHTHPSPPLAGTRGRACVPGTRSQPPAHPAPRPHRAASPCVTSRPAPPRYPATPPSCGTRTTETSLDSPRMARRGVSGLSTSVESPPRRPVPQVPAVPRLRHWRGTQPAKGTHHDNGIHVRQRELAGDPW